ncbi:uncharacterized protein LOC107624507 [Arachis ipaensis]|uniref:uncharacterized protein LOC107624507 n=1 Tax=Arachis ipaensis TaxID=130454 RepID=UPI000A2B4FCE|nr:uncharacterized protein LOC107624507 [Arachis ipaensis]QHN82358.1 uncharacterized protein DS421_20g695120 [Arachis hypogaea]
MSPNQGREEEGVAVAPVAVAVRALSSLPFHGDASPSLSDGGKGRTRGAAAAGLLFCHRRCHVMEEEVALPPSELAVANAYTAAVVSSFCYYFLIVMPSALPLEGRRG